MMRLKQKLFFLPIMAILMICLPFNILFSQELPIHEIALPSEIKTINTLTSNNDDGLWIGSGQGLFYYRNNKFTRFYDENQKELYCVNEIEFDTKGNIWYGTYNGVLVKFGEQKILKTYDIKSQCKSDNYIITSISVNKNDPVNANQILLTTSGGEIFSIDTVTSKISVIKSPSNGTIYNIQYGYANIIWLCTSDGFYTTQQNWKWKKKADLYTAYGLYENDGKYWAIGRNKEKEATLMLYFDEEGEGKNKNFKWKEFNLSKLSNKYSRFYKLAISKGEMIWLASDDGLICYNPLSAKVTEIKNFAGSKVVAIQNITAQNKKLIWISTSGKKLFKVDVY